MSAIGSLAALNIETKPRSWVRIEPALGLVVGLGGGMLQSLALGTPITHGLAIGGAFGLVFGILSCAPRHQRRRRIDLGTGRRVPHVAGLPRWTAPALHQGRPLDGGSG